MEKHQQQTSNKQTNRKDNDRGRRKYRSWFGI